MNRTFLGLVAASTVVLAISACKEETPVEQPTTSQPDASGKENTRNLEENEQLR